MNITYDDLNKLWNRYYIENDIGEIQGLLKHVEKINPLKVILEIGVCFGGTLRIWEHLLPEDGIVIGIDKVHTIREQLTGNALRRDKGHELFGKPGNDWEIESDEYNIIKLKSDKEIYVINEDSAAPRTKAGVEHLLKGRAVDFIFHDGIHYGPGPIYDYANFQHMLRVGGVLCIADGMDPDNPATQGPNLGTQALYHALPPPKLNKVEPHVSGMALWAKQEDFILEPEAVIKQYGLDYYGTGPTGA